MQERYDAFIQTIDAEAERPRNERVEIFGRTYDALFPMSTFQGLGKFGDQDLILVFRAALNAARLVGRRSHVRHAELAFDELESRGLATPKQSYYMQGVYIQQRMLPEATRFRRQHPAVGLDAVPVVRAPEQLESGQPTELVVSRDGTLLHRSVDISSPVQIVVVAHPRCHFSRDAVRAIESDPVLADAFRRSSKWVVPPDFSFDVNAVQRWNTAHQESRLSLAYAIEEWPQLDYWGTPTFYFFRHGKLEVKVTGWPKEGRREELVDALRQVGLLSDGA